MPSWYQAGNERRWMPVAATAAVPYIGQVATRCYLPNTQFAGGFYHQFNSRTAHWTSEAVTSLKLRWPHFRCVPQENAAGIGNNTIFASIEYPAATFTQVTWSAATSVVMTEGSLSTLSDAISVTIPANTKFWVRSYQTGSGTVDEGSYLVDVGQNSLGDGFEFALSGLTDKTMSGTVTAVANGDYVFPPCAIVATTVRPAVALLGDSRVYGFFDFPTNGDRGELAGSIGNTYGYINMGVNSDKAQQFVSTHTNRLILAGYCSHVLLEYGINDLAASRTDAQLQSDLNTILGYFPSSPVFLTTVPPATTSSDSWATTANQTIAAYNPDRVLNNNWRRGVPSGYSGIFEVADVVESARDSGKWNVDGSASKYTADGVHESSFAFGLISSSGVIPTSAFHRP